MRTGHVHMNHVGSYERLLVVDAIEMTLAYRISDSILHILPSSGVLACLEGYLSLEVPLAQEDKVGLSA